MKRPFALLFFFIISVFAKAGDSVQVRLNQMSFGAKDTIIFAVNIPHYQEHKLAAVTMHLWIQDLETRRTWKYRYPVLNGEGIGALAIGDSIKPGRYALNFIFQNTLFRVNGRLKNQKQQTLNYLMVTKEKKSYLNSVDLDPMGSFTIKNMLFADEAIFVFSPTKKVRENDLFIDVATPLDSSFTPVAVVTEFIDVKPERMRKVTEPGKPYRFDFSKSWQNTTLPDVVIVSKAKSRMKQYDEQYSSGLFRDDNAKVFDGLDNDEISKYADILSFLEGHINGIKIDRMENTLHWRGEPVTLYIDEFALQQGDPIFINPSEVAMIKVYDPPAFMNFGGTGGAVAIYTKKGAYESNNNRRYRFTLKGYTAQESTWR